MLEGLEFEDTVDFLF